MSMDSGRATECGKERILEEFEFYYVQLANRTVVRVMINGVRAGSLRMTPGQWDLLMCAFSSGTRPHMSVSFNQENIRESKS
jgi:hypothetical protein